MEIEQLPLSYSAWWAGYDTRSAIVNHIMQGYIAGSWSRFNNPKEQVSAHFGVGLSGRVVQWVDMNNSAWANGILEEGWNRTLPWLVDTVNKKRAINRQTISIEHEGFPGGPMPEKQYQATLDLHIHIIKAFPSLLPGRKTIVRHSDISPQSRANCPGPSFPLARLIDDLQGEFIVNSLPVVPGHFPVRDEFANFWGNRGGLQMFGYPLGPEIQANGKYGAATVVQYFERARFELQPNGTVILGLVGFEAIQFRVQKGTV